MNDQIEELISSNVKLPIDIKNFSHEILFKFYRDMLLIRKVEDEVAQLVRDAEVNCPCHLGAGQKPLLWAYVTT